MTPEQRSSAPLGRIAVHPLGTRAGEIVLLPHAEIWYAFLGSAAPTELLAICKTNGWRMEPDRVYVRTARGIFRTGYRRLAGLRRELEADGPSSFLPIGRARMVNTFKITALHTGSRAALLVFASAEAREMLTVTRRAWPRIRERLRLPRRRGGA